jgi:hypothetical protein
MSLLIQKNDNTDLNSEGTALSGGIARCSGTRIKHGRVNVIVETKLAETQRSGRVSCFFDQRPPRFRPKIIYTTCAEIWIQVILLKDITKILLRDSCL